MNLNARNADLDSRISDTDLPGAVDTLIRDARKRKRQMILLTSSVVFDLLLTVGLSVMSVQTHRLASRSESNKTAIIRTCESNNNSRANNKELWTYLLSQPPTEPVDPGRQAKIDQFRAFVNKTFAPRDCKSVVEN